MPETVPLRNLLRSTETFADWPPAEEKLNGAINAARAALCEAA